MCANDNTSADVAAVAEAVKAEMIPVFIMGKKYDVPDSLTIMKAMEHAGFQFVRGCGCRGGVCGACGTVWRYTNDYKLHTGLAFSRHPVRPHIQGDGRGANNLRRAARHPRPRYVAGQAEQVEHGRIVAIDARRQDVALPGACREFDAIELRDHRAETFWPN